MNIARFAPIFVPNLTSLSDLISNRREGNNKSQCSCETNWSSVCLFTFLAICSSLSDRVICAFVETINVPAFNEAQYTKLMSVVME